MFRKSYLLLFLILNSSFLIHNSFSQWVSIGPDTGIISLAVKSNYIFAGSYNGIFYTSNMGLNWFQTLYNQPIRAILIFNNYIFAGTYDSNGVYVSSDNGQNWIQSGLLNELIYSFTSNSNYIFAGVMNDGIYLSSNNGTTWIQTSLNNKSVHALLSNGNYIFAGTDAYGVFYSTNYGVNWIQTSLNSEPIYSLADNVSRIFAGSYYSQVWYSTDNGITWYPTELEESFFCSLFTIGNNVLTGSSYNGIYLSTNNGVNWVQKDEGLPFQSGVIAISLINNYVIIGTWPYSVYKRPIDELIGIKPISSQFPNNFHLYQNYPNPFNPTTKIKFDIPEIPLSRGVSEGRGVSVKLIIYDILGREIATLVNEKLNPGTYEIEWDASNFSSGVYFYKLTTSNPDSPVAQGSGFLFSQTKRMVLLK